MAGFYGNVPASLRRWCDKHPGRVVDIDRDDGYTTTSGMAYDILLAPGWICDGTHIIIAETVREALNRLSEIQPCDCTDCLERKARASSW